MVVASTLCYIQHNGKTLMLHRVKKDKDIHKGKYNGLGGKFLPGETPLECVKREVKEESGLEISNPRLRGVMSFPEFKDKEDWLVFLFTVNEFQGDLQSCDEGNLQWVPDEDLLNLHLWEGDKFFLTWLKEDRRFFAKFIYKEGNLIEHSVEFFD